MLVNFSADKRPVAYQQFVERTGNGSIKSFGVDLDVTHFGQLSGELRLEIIHQVFSRHAEFEEMAVVPLTGAFVQAAIAKARVGIFELKFAILRGGGEHQ